MPTTVIHKFVTNEQKVALTIDDGPYAEEEAGAITARMLDELGRRGVKATFFLIGWRTRRLFKESIPGVPGSGIEPSDALLARFAAEGHEICNHTYHHPPNYIQLRGIRAQAPTCQIFHLTQANRRGRVQ